MAGENTTSDDVRATYLTADELHVIYLLHEAAIVFRQILGDGPTRSMDLIEGVDKIHQLQAVVMAQAAARAYPEIFRLLGETPPGDEEKTSHAQG